MMLTKKAGRFSKFRQYILVAALMGSVSLAQAEDDAPTAAEMLKSAMKAMEAKRYDAAIESLYMYLGVVSESKAPRVLAIAQDARFKLASLLLQEKRYDEAAAVLQEYVDLPLANKPRHAMKMLATCYFDAQLYEECASTITNALYYNENPVLLSERSSGKDDEDGEDYSEEEIEPEEEYTQADLTTLNMTLAESYFNIEKWEECIEPFSYVIEHTPNEQRKGYAIMQIINALIEIPAFDRIMDWVPQLYRTDARYDIRVNLALMNAAAALHEAEEYDSALPLYRMILPRDELITFQEARMRDMRVAVGLAPDEGVQMTEDEMLIFGADEPVDPAAVSEDTAVVEDDKPKELVELENLIVALKNLPPYELDIQYRMADLYKTVERYWEALKFFDAVYSADPTTEVGERCIYELVDMLLESLNELGEAEKHAHKHMGKYKEGMTPRQLAYMLTGYYQKNQMMPTIKTLKPYIDEFVRTNDTTVVKYDTELYFMQAVSDLMMQKYEEAEKSFKYVLDEFPNSHQEANCTYWYAMSQLFLQKYADGFPNFERYIEKFPAEQYIDECYFQGGICLFGQEKYTNAFERFTYVIESYPDSSVYPEACSMRGDLYGAGEIYTENDYLERAIADYDRAFNASQKPTQATYATFQMAEVYEAEEKYDDIIRVVERYKSVWKEEADIAKALFWIGKTKIQQKLYDEAVSTYLDAIVEYGGDLRQDGVDQMIAELVKLSKIYLGSEQQDKLIADLETARDVASNETLQLRLRVLLANLQNTEIELGEALITELESLDNASPPVLATICDASFEKEDFSRSEEILRIFINKFEDSDFMRAAYKLRGYGQYAEKDYEGVQATINDAQSLYGTEYDVAWAQLLKAKVFLDEGKLDESREAYMSILTVPSWRGVPVAEATYQLGKVEEAAGNLPKAFGFYQRAYFQYKGHAGGHWAVEGYLASAEVLKKMGRENDVRNTYRALLFDPYVNTLPQADVASKYLGSAEVAEIAAYLETGATSNITISVDAKMTSGSGESNKEAEDKPSAETTNESSTEEKE